MKEKIVDKDGKIWILIDGNRSYEIDKNQCPEIYEMQDTAYMVNCELVENHEGKHVFSWNTGENQ